MSGSISRPELQELESRWVMPTYKRAEVEFVRGEGARLWDSEGKGYLDFLTGISVCSVGHCHPAVVEAVREQAGVLMHASNLYLTEGGVRLAERICASSLDGKAFLCNSGAEANECAIKLARKHAHGRGIGEPEIVVLEGAFHGRTMGAVSATPGMAADESFAPYLPGFVTVPRDDPDALRGAVGERTAAVMLEPIQGEAGVHVISDDVIAAAREASEGAGALLVLDEIQTGMGRTGSLWAYEQLTVRPDVITSAKALGGGLPVGACVAAPDDRRHPAARRPRLDLRGRPAGRGRRPRRLRRDRRPGAAARRARAGRKIARGIGGDAGRRRGPRAGSDAGGGPAERGRRRAP